MAEALPLQFRKRIPPESIPSGLFPDAVPMLTTVGSLSPLAAGRTAGAKTVFLSTILDESVLRTCVQYVVPWRRFDADDIVVTTAARIHVQIRCIKDGCNLVGSSLLRSPGFYCLRRAGKEMTVLKTASDIAANATGGFNGCVQ